MIAALLEGRVDQLRVGAIVIYSRLQTHPGLASRSCGHRSDERRILLDEPRARRVAWVARAILPHEPAVRRWLRRSRVTPDEEDDILQDAYCRLSGLETVDHINYPKAYFFQIVRAVVADRMRKARVVRFETLTEIDESYVISEEPSSERILSARLELEFVLDLIRKLPERCRRVIELRKIEGLSQKDIALKLGITETIVENDVVKGMRIISEAFKRETETTPSGVSKRGNDQSRNRRRY